MSHQQGYDFGTSSIYVQIFIKVIYGISDYKMYNRKPLVEDIRSQLLILTEYLGLKIYGFYSTKSRQFFNLLFSFEQ